MPDRPQLAFRVGVTGARRLPAASLSFLREQVGKTLRLVAAELLQLNQEFGENQGAEAAYQGIPRLRVTSPLARGADRLFAKTAIDLHANGVAIELCVPTPFPIPEYEQDFSGVDDNAAGEKALRAEEDLAEFRDLLSHAAGVVELDGTHADVTGIHSSAPLAYEAAGRYVVRHSDFMMAIWDGKPSNGRGGTAEMVLQAVNSGVPLLWIHATHQVEPIWIDDLHTLHSAMATLQGASDPWERLRTYMRRQVALPSSLVMHPHGVLDKLAFLLKPKKLNPASTYFSEKVGRRWFVWRVHSWLMTLAGGQRPSWAPTPEPLDSLGKYWFSLYNQADSLASEYAARYRSSYVWTIAFSTATFILGTVSGSLRSAHGFSSHAVILAILEMLCLLMILLNVILAIRNEWHEKSIEYRLLAELFRKQQTLAIVDWTLPLKSVQHCVDTERLLWVQWLFAAAERSAPLSKGTRLPNLERKYWIDHLLQEQISYHEARRAVSNNVLRVFESIGTICFLFLILCVAIKVFLEIHQEYEVALVVVGLLTVILPALSAAFITLRGYAELQLLVDQSKQMAAELIVRKQALRRIDLARPLASIDLGEQALGITTLMLQDLEGWGRLFRGKLMEAG